MVAQDSSSIVNLGSYAGANMVSSNSTDLVNIGSYAGNLSALTNSTHVYTWGYQAGRLLAGDGYTNIYLLGDNAQPTRKTNEFVFGSANDLVTIPGGAMIANGFTNTGTSSFTWAETVTTNSRPVAWNMSYQAAPGSLPAGGTDWHGIDLTGWSSWGFDGPLCRLYPFESTAKYFGAIGGRLGMAVPMYSQVVNYNGGTVDLVKGLRLLAQNLSTGIVDTVVGTYFETPLNAGGGTVSNVIGHYVQPLTSGSISNIAVYIGNPSGGSAANYGLFSLADTNYIAGQLGIGTNAPQTYLQVAGVPKNMGGSAWTGVYGTADFFDPQTAGVGAGGLITFQGYYTTTANHAAFGAVGASKELAAAGNAKGELDFYVSPGTGPLTKSMWIASTGIVEVLTTLHAGTSIESAGDVKASGAYRNGLTVGSTTYIDANYRSQTNQVAGALTFSYCTNGVNGVDSTTVRWLFNSSGSDQTLTFPIINTGVNGWRTNVYSAVPPAITNGTIMKVILDVGGPTDTLARQTNCYVKFEYYQ